MTVVIRDGFRWIAEADGVAHAHPERRRSARALCGITALDERFARPPVVRCSRCTEVAQGR